MQKRRLVTMFLRYLHPSKGSDDTWVGESVARRGLLILCSDLPCAVCVCMLFLYSKQPLYSSLKHITKHLLHRQYHGHTHTIPPFFFFFVACFRFLFEWVRFDALLLTPTSPENVYIYIYIRKAQHSTRYRFALPSRPTFCALVFSFLLLLLTIHSTLLFPFPFPPPFVPLLPLFSIFTLTDTS